MWEECTGYRHYKWKECTGDGHYMWEKCTDSYLQDRDNTDGHYITLFAEQLTRTFEVLVFDSLPFIDKILRRGQATVFTRFSVSFTCNGCGNRHTNLENYDGKNFRVVPLLTLGTNSRLVTPAQLLTDMLSEDLRWVKLHKTQCNSALWVRTILNQSDLIILQNSQSKMVRTHYSAICST